MAKRIHHTFFFPHSVEVVWDYLTRAELMEQWLMKNDFLPLVGYDFTFKANPAPSIDFDGIVYCKVLEVVPHKRLSYSWKTGPGDGKILIDSVVVWELHQKDNGVELDLVHSGFNELDHVNMFNALNGGWNSNIQKIAKLINEAHGTNA